MRAVTYVWPIVATVLRNVAGGVLMLSWLIVPALFMWSIEP